MIEVGHAELIYDALADAPGLRPDGVWILLFTAAMVQAVFLIPALIVLGSMRARPWTAAGKTTLGNVTSKQFLLGLLTAGILAGPAIATLFAIGPDLFSAARWGFSIAACLGVLVFYPALATFRSMIPGAKGGVGNAPSYQVAARGPTFGLLAIGLLLVPLLAGGLLASSRWDGLRSSLARGDHLTAVGTLDRARITYIERRTRPSSWLEEHDTFTLDGGEVFEAACTHRSGELLTSGRPYICVRANIGDKLTIAYRDKASPQEPAPALRVWCNRGGHG